MDGVELDVEYYPKLVGDYIASVMSGATITGKHQRYAVQRHLSDLETQGDRGLFFDEDAANRACMLFAAWKHTEGAQFANKPVILEPWQAFVVWNLFGWKRVDFGLRRYRRAYINVAAKAGKTTFMAAMALILAIADEPEEAGAQGYIVATTLNQAKILFTQAVRFAENNEYVADVMRVYRAAPERLEWAPTHSMIRPIVVGPNIDGINAHFIIRDELHAFRESHREGCGKLPSRMAARQQPFMIDITTAGSDESLLWDEEHRHATAVVESVAHGKILDDSYFAFICSIDENDDPFEESNWVKANPSIGVTVSYDYYREQATRAKELPTAHGDFLRYQCNIKTAASTRAIMPEHWATGNDPICHAEWQEGFGGVDLSRTRDLTAISAVFPVRGEDGSIVRWDVLSKSWAAREGRLDLRREPFRSWVHSGRLGIIEGDRIVYDEIEEEIRRWSEVYNVAQWAFDPNRAAELMNRLQEDGIAVFPFTQNAKKYNEPCERFQDECQRGRIRHGGDPVLAWQIGNMEFVAGDNGLVMPNKRSIATKIDAACATLMAFQGCLFAERTAASYYDKNGMEMF